MYFKKQQQKKDKQIYLWNLYHISDLILQQTHKHGKLHPKQNQATRRFKTITQTHTQSNNSFLYESLWKRERKRRNARESERKRAARREVKQTKKDESNRIVIKYLHGTHFHKKTNI